jgi:hypothetical protein
MVPQNVIDIHVGLEVRNMQVTVFVCTYPTLLTKRDLGRRKGLSEPVTKAESTFHAYV